MNRNDWTPLLTGTVGSHAYGLAGPDSDVDTLGMAAAPTAQFHGLSLPTGKAATRASNDPDVTVHEAGKYVSLALACNPTILELLYLPDELYQVRHELGDELIALRGKLLHAHGVRNAYMGYATQQFTRLKNRGRFPNVPTSRIAKHARHLLRLVHAGTALYLTGELTVRVHEPQRYHDFAALIVADPEKGLALAESTLALTQAALDAKPSVLPERPNQKAAEQWLMRVRAHHYSRARRSTAKTVEPAAGRPYVPVEGTPRAVLVDIDGTVALHGDRDPYDTSRYHEDGVNIPVVLAVKAMLDAGHEVIMCSGRDEAFRDVTDRWLYEQVLKRYGLPYADLHMRPEGDTRRDDIVKLELFDKHIRDNYTVTCVFDDRDRVVKAWRGIGLTVLQVAEGNF
jgi:predicted nucleotidyltransferase